MTYLKNALARVRPDADAQSAGSGCDAVMFMVFALVFAPIIVAHMVLSLG